MVDINQIVTSEKFKHNDKGPKYFVGYENDDNINRSLCIILPQMSGYIKYFDNSRKSMSFVIEDDSVLVKYNEIQNKITETLDKKLHSEPVYDEGYIRTKVKTFNDIVNTIF